MDHKSNEITSSNRNLWLRVDGDTHSKQCLPPTACSVLFPQQAVAISHSKLWLPPTKGCGYLHLLLYV